MSLIGLSIQILWLALGIIVICAIIWVALWAVRQFLPVPPPVEKLIWACVLILVLIAVLSAIGGVGPFSKSFRVGSAWASHHAWGPAHMQTLLTDG